MLNNSPALNDIEDYGYDGNDQENVNYSTCIISKETNQPTYNEYDGDNIKQISHGINI